LQNGLGCVTDAVTVVLARVMLRDLLQHRTYARIIIDNYVHGAYTGDNAADRVTQYEYDALSRKIGSTASYTSTVMTGRTDLNRHAATTYDPLTGRIIGHQDALLRWVHLQYDKLGRVTKTVQNCRSATDVAVSQGCAPFAAGDLSKSDRNVPTITAYDALGRTTAITDTLGHVTLTTYDGLGRVQSTIQNYVAGAPATNDTNVTTQTVYDVMGRTIAVTDALSGTTRLEYDQLGHTAVVTDTMGRVTRFGYDGSGTQRWTERAVGTAEQRLSVFQVDRLGRVVATIENYQNGAVEQNEATDRDRITRTVYDLAGRPVQTIDAAGVITAFGYDLEDRLIWVQQNVQEMCATTATDCNVVMRYAYDRMGNRIEVNSKTLSAQRFTYDAADRMLTSTDPLTQTTSWEYDKLGRMLVQHDPRGTAYDVHYTSDGLDRVTNTTSADTSVTSSATYDGLGRRRSLTDPTGTTNFTYDNLGRLTQVAAPNTGTVGYGYNALGQRTQLSYPSGPTIDYSYWGDGQLKDVRQGTSILANYSYDPAGRLQQVTQANNAVTKYAYDTLDRLVDQRTLVGTTQTSDYSYQYDRLGVRTQATETIASGSFNAVPRMPHSLLTTSAVQSPSQEAASAQIAGATPSQATGNAPNSTPDLGQMPLAFVPNVGQTDQSVRFQVHSADGGMMFFTPGEIVLSLPTPDVDESNNAAAQHRRGRGTATVRLRFDGAAKTPAIASESRETGVVNYLTGNNKANWHTNVPTYASIVYQQLYPGIDLRYSGEHGQLKSTYTLAAGADASRIRWRYHGGKDAHVDDAGRLVIAVPLPGKKQGPEQQVLTLTESAPIAWQERGGQRIAVSVRYTIDQGGSISFVLGDYDRNLPLTIDPALVYSSNLGGGGDDRGKGIAVDSAGSSYIVGSTASLVFPTTSGTQAAHGGGSYDAFVSKLSANGQTLVYSTYLGGTGWDEGTDIALDSAGNAYVTGKTSSANFPTVNPLQAALAGQDDTFVTKLSANGQTLVYSTYLGGNNTDTAGGIAIDTSGNAYVTGKTNSTTFPVVSAFQNTHAGSGDVFVSKLSANGQSLIYSTYVGGSGDDSGNGIAVNNAGQAYITGIADGRSTTVFPTTAGAFQTTCSSSTCSASTAFVTKLSATGNGLVYSTYLGGSSTNEGQGIAVDATGNAYVTGGTQSTNFPTTTGAPQRVNNGSSDAFLAKLNPTASGLVYSTYLGGNGNDYANDVAVDSAGNASLAGYTTSTSNFPLVSPRKTVLGGSRDAFVAKVNSAGSALSYSTYLGGSDSDEANDIAVDSSGHAYVTGSTLSTADFPTVNAYQSTSSGDIDGFVTKLNASDSVLLYSTYLGGAGDNVGRSIAVDSAGYAYVTGYTRSGSFPVANAQQQAPGGGYDAFVTKVNSSNAGLIYSTYLGGSGNDDGRDITVDAAGQAYVTGNTTSSDFPTVSPFQAQHQGSFEDVFVVKLNASGNALTYSSYLGGSGEDIGHAIAIDSAGNMIVTDSTDSSNFPTSHASQSTLRGKDAFVTKLNPAGSALLYSTYFGGNGEERGRSLALANNGKIAITGFTSSSDLPITQGYQSTYGGGTSDSFVAQIDPSLTGAPSLGYSSYLGGSGLDIGYGITVDPAGVLYLTGSASSSNFPIKDGLQTMLNGSSDAYVVKLNPAAAGQASLVYSTYLGGSGVEYGLDIALNQQGQIHVTGSTSSTNFPTATPLYGTLKGGMDAFVTVYHPTGDSLISSTYLGSSRDDYGYGISVDSQGNIYITGSTAWSDFPKANASGTIYVYPNNYAFVAKILSPVRVVTYNYDALQRLTGATEQPGFAYSYTYDKLGNRTAASVNGSLWQSRHYNAANQVVGWTYDAAGNLLNDGSQSWTYDALGRLRSNTSTSTTNYTYNGDGTLVSQTSSGTTTRYTQDLAAPLAQVLQTTQGTNPRTSYLYGAQRLGSLTGTIRTWYGSDVLGSVRQTLTDSGTIAATLHYDPWGMPAQQSSPVPFGFTGELQTARSGLVHLRARWYQAGQGSFLSRDPFAGFPTQPYSLHPYQYGYSNPVLHTDPTGKWTCLADWGSGLDIGCDKEGVTNDTAGGAGGGSIDGFCQRPSIWNEATQQCEQMQVSTGTVVVIPGGASLTKVVEACINLLGIWAISKVSEEVSVDVTPKKQDTKTPLWRAVNDAELLQLITTGKFQDWTNPSGYVATENKYFSLTLEGGMREAVILSQLKHERYTVVQTAIPTRFLSHPSGVSFAPVDGGVPAVVIRTFLYPMLDPPIVLPISYE
jgi:RHS repeat-associated protein